MYGEDLFVGQRGELHELLPKRSSDFTKLRAKRVIYLFQHGTLSQFDVFDYKPALQKLRGTDLPDSVRMGQRLTGVSV